MSHRLIRLQGFEEGLADRVGAGFTFANPSYEDLVLVPGRHLFADTMLEVEKLQTTYPDFNPEHEPTISFASIIGPGLPPTSSSSSKQEWNIQTLLRFGKAPEVVKGLVEELANFLMKLRGRLSTGFFLKGTEMVFRPTVLEIKDNDLCLASTVIRFRAVPLPN